jgi:hypothetical protein
MNVQPKPSIEATCLPGAREGADRPSPLPRGRVPVAGPRMLFTWPVEFEVEPWHP